MHRERIIFQGPDGSLAVVTPVESIRIPESVEAFINRVAARAAAVDPSLAGYTRIAVVDVSRLPATRRFRDQWRHIGGQVYTDEVLARAKLLAELRTARDAALLASDHEKTKLDEIGTEEERAALATYRQSLRDLPAVVSAEITAMTLAELTDYKPSLPKVK
jgi:hypothetical protein